GMTTRPAVKLFPLEQDLECDPVDPPPERPDDGEAVLLTCYLLLEVKFLGHVQSHSRDSLAAALILFNTYNSCVAILFSRS
ncbi:MAG: hypothetical protein GY928_12440, partial [Colwellia sp.]|nr:hypothetical protein [Colwellia sp.]